MATRPSDPHRANCCTKPNEFEIFSNHRVREAFLALEAKHERLLESLHDMTFEVSQEGRFLRVNQAGAQLFDFESKEEMLLLGSVAQLYDDPDAHGILTTRLQQEGFVEDYLVEMKKRNGKKFLASISANLCLGQGSAISYEGSLRDVSENRKWQNALIESIKHNRRLKESDEYNRELVNHIVQMLMIMSHDIRGPLVAMAATLKLLIRGTYGGMDQSVENTLRDLLSRVRNLLGVAEEYLGKMQCVEGSLKSECETLDLRQDVIDPLLDELSNDIQLNEITIDSRLGAIPAGTIRINVNRIWLKAVFRNLFKNAMKYGGKGCRIAFGFQDHGAYYRLNVYNSGRSIPEEYRPRLFTKYGRIKEDGGEECEGVGLGLYLIREIVRKHGGDIWYEARPDGSDFIFTLNKETG